MDLRFADRMNNAQKSFIREILKVVGNPEIISFAGGLPNPISFPVKKVQEATDKILEEDGENVLQYSTTEGYLPLREYISERYLKNSGVVVPPDEILITNGSQQGLDLIGKVFLNKGDVMLMEEPGYLGAIQAFSMFEPEFKTVPIRHDGVDTEKLKESIKKYNPKLFYAVPNFHNPSGITYSEENRKQVSDIMKDSSTIFIEDDPYGELRFIGNKVPSMKKYMNDNVILLGSFSKIVSPGMRLGWIHAAPEIMDKLIIAKQGADLHSNYFSQRVVYEYLKENNIEIHIEKITNLYKKQRDCMVNSIEKYFPKEVEVTKPEGGMFIWVTLPENYSSMDLFNIAIEKKVAFVPGDPFYVGVEGVNAFRLNYTNSTEEKIEEGIKILAESIKELLSE
ncbi:PLP-dependent aminotransferase family protein [Sebaldella sp. S0638]|uniref:aminotransferase-like domain-containing protein n=1 Tax=Sebaldella sp. S0638 TaxID=2957809 RepID=UPI0020A11A23|nr:PLP-dependent aminotransferase family protein [Sebaldella sp. S0638]MCP1225006.1 PLP-dependent aminotransferase family protein [Sebaldella sp. S0638]